MKSVSVAVPQRSTTARRPSLRAAVAGSLAAAFAVTGCGNYSNEDLEFMDVLPKLEDVEVQVPPRAALLVADAAPSWQTTWNVTRTMNGVAAAFLGLVDGIRSHYPTSGEGNLRVWGPFPAENQPGWQVLMRMTKGRDPVTAQPRFDYVLAMLPPPGVVVPTGSEVEIISGDFSVTGGVRRGVGHLDVTIDEARAAGLVLPGLEKLRTLAIAYDNSAWPRHLHMVLDNLPPADPTKESPHADYDYLRAENGDAAMAFSFQQDVVPGPLGVDVVFIESRWLARGEGRSHLSVLSGDGAGAATVLECWDERFQSTYRLASWEIFPTGDAATCIPAS